jgi:predicted RNA-binding Zn-ribbon protein involved in translation (DUF1610 family)
MANPSAIRADCPSCGTVEVGLDDASLVLGFEQAPAHVLRYMCPSCGTARTDAIGEHATRLLMTAGIGLLGSATTAPISPEGPSTRSSS